MICRADAVTGAAVLRAAGFPSASAYLPGVWEVHRHLHDRREEHHGSFRGEALFTPASGTLDYAEAGELHWPPYRGAASRRLRYDFPGPWILRVFFADGQPFHSVDLSDASGEAEHLCGADLYRGTYRFDGADRWSVRWHVSGPAKDLVLSTDYRRLSRHGMDHFGPDSARSSAA